MGGQVKIGIKEMDVSTRDLIEIIVIGALNLGFHRPCN